MQVSRTAARFTQADMARALRAAEQVAPGEMLVEVAPDGVIRIAPISTPSTDRSAPVPLAPRKDWRL
jgi:hypothetical protein